MLGQLARVREQRRRVRARELDKRLDALARAQAALARQESLLDVAQGRLQQSHRLITGIRTGARVDAHQLSQHQAWITSQRHAVATEQAATVAANTAHDMIQREVTRAGEALRAAAVAQHKAAVAQDRTHGQRLSEAEAGAERVLDEQTALRHHSAQVRGGPR